MSSVLELMDLIMENFALWLSSFGRVYWAKIIDGIESVHRTLCDLVSFEISIQAVHGLNPMYICNKDQ